MLSQERERSPSLAKLISILREVDRFVVGLQPRNGGHCDEHPIVQVERVIEQSGGFIVIAQVAIEVDGAVRPIDIDHNRRVAIF